MFGEMSSCSNWRKFDFHSLMNTHTHTHTHKRTHTHTHTHTHTPQTISPYPGNSLRRSSTSILIHLHHIEHYSNKMNCADSLSIAKHKVKGCSNQKWQRAWNLKSKDDFTYLTHPNVMEKKSTTTCHTSQ